MRATCSPVEYTANMTGTAGTANTSRVAATVVTHVMRITADATAIITTDTVPHP